MGEFKIDDVVRVTANAAELEKIAADPALLGQTATITETLGRLFRLTGPSLPKDSTWIQARHIELASREHKTLNEMRQILSDAGYDSEDMLDDLRELVQDSQRPATEAMQ